MSDTLASPSDMPRGVRGVAPPGDDCVVPPPAFGLSLILTVADSPGATFRVYQNAHLVPCRSGLTVAAPLTTWSLMPSFGYDERPAVPQIRSLLVSLSQNSGTPESSCVSDQTLSPNAATNLPVAAVMTGTSSLPRSPHDQTLRNQKVGRTWIVASSGPMFVTRTRMSRSRTSAFA